MQQALIASLTVLIIAALALGTLAAPASTAPAAWAGSPAGSAAYFSSHAPALGVLLAPAAAPAVPNGILPSSVDFNQSIPKCSTRSRSRSPRYCSATTQDAACSAQVNVYQCSALGRGQNRAVWCSIRFNSTDACSAAPNPAGQRQCSAAGPNSFCSTAVKHSANGACSANSPLNIRCSAFTAGALCSTYELNGSVTNCDRF